MMGYGVFYTQSLGSKKMWRKLTMMPNHLFCSLVRPCETCGKLQPTLKEHRSRGARVKMIGSEQSPLTSQQILRLSILHPDTARIEFPKKVYHVIQKRFLTSMRVPLYLMVPKINLIIKMQAVK
jgi:hypothetical protein